MKRLSPGRAMRLALIATKPRSAAELLAETGHNCLPWLYRHGLVGYDAETAKFAATRKGLAVLEATATRAVRPRRKKEPE